MNYNKELTKATAKLLKDCLKMNWPNAAWKVNTHRGGTIDLISVHFEGEAELLTVAAFVDSWEKDDLYIKLSGNTYQLI
jgi:hypothetical protein